MSGKNHILHVITGLANGGAEAVLHRLCSTDKQHAHTVISLMDAGYYGPKLEAQGIRVHTLEMPRGSVTASGLFKLWRLIREERPDLVQTWMYHADLLGGIVARLAGIRPVVWGVHHTVLERGKSSRVTMLVAWILARLSPWIPRQIALCAEKSARVHAALGYDSAKMVVIANGYDLRNFVRSEQGRAALRAEWGVDDAIPLLGMVSRYDPQKDHANLIAALGQLKRSGLQFQCLLVGPGMTADNVELMGLIEQAGLRDVVKLTGSRGDIPAVMSALDLHLLSSSAEAFPNVLAEAMACGTPSVTTDVGDASLIVGDTGWVVPPGNSAALADAIRLALDARNSEEWVNRQRAARRRVEENFSVEHMVAGYHAVWQRALVGQP